MIKRLKRGNQRLLQMIPIKTHHKYQYPCKGDSRFNPFVHFDASVVASAGGVMNTCATVILPAVYREKSCPLYVVDRIIFISE